MTELKKVECNIKGAKDRLQHAEAGLEEKKCYSREKNRKTKVTYKWNMGSSSRSLKIETCRKK